MTNWTLGCVDFIRDPIKFKFMIYGGCWVYFNRRIRRIDGKND